MPHKTKKTKKNEISTVYLIVGIFLQLFETKGKHRNLVALNRKKTQKLDADLKNSVKN